MKIKTLNSEIKNTISCNAKVGLILLATDQITLYEFAVLLKGTKILYFPARVANSTNINTKTLLAIKNELKKATNTILPGIKLDVVAFSCTSATMVIGEDEVAKIIRQSDKNRIIKEVTNPYSAIKSACSFLSVEEMGLITPYTKYITKGIITGMQNVNINIKTAASFKIASDNVVPDITRASIERAVIDMAKDSAVATIFVSCTNLNICQAIKKLELITGKTILTSNQVMAWDILRLVKYKKPILGFGSLLARTR